MIYVRQVTADGIHLVVAGHQGADTGEEVNKVMVDVGLAKAQTNTTLFDMLHSTSDQGRLAG